VIGNPQQVELMMFRNLAKKFRQGKSFSGFGILKFIKINGFSFGIQKFKLFFYYFGTCIFFFKLLKKNKKKYSVMLGF
jgi:hypothetical protein